MTLIVEDGTGISNADSYASVAQLVAYAALYGKTIPSDDGTAEIMLRQGMDFIESKKYKGKKEFATTINLLLHPRTDVYIDRQLLDPLVELTQIQRALFEICLGIFAGIDPLAVTGGKVVSAETFGVLQRTFATGKETPLYNPRVALFLDPLLANQNAPLHFRVVSDKESAYLCKHKECNGQGCIYLGDGYSYYE